MCTVHTYQFPSEHWTLNTDWETLDSYTCPLRKSYESYTWLMIESYGILAKIKYQNKGKALSVPELLDIRFPRDLPYNLIAFDMLKIHPPPRQSFSQWGCVDLAYKPKMKKYDFCLEILIKNWKLRFDPMEI